uniref:Uncharacterized protein n=1 Tax=Timema bartmani TaxID=61472 RepID=A0A7R9EXX0_9NEOP|nr:unnamed protein product [Timema bartmani]
MSVESCDSELLESAYANVGLHADPVWLLNEPDVYQRANQVLWVCCNRLWHHTRSFRVNNVLPQNRIQTRSVRDTIPFSRLARYGNYRYDEERESHYMCDDESGDARYGPIVCPEENPEPWMLPEVEQEFKRLTKEELPGEYTLAFKRAGAYHPRAFMPAKDYHPRDFKKARPYHSRALKRARAYRPWTFKKAGAYRPRNFMPSTVPGPSRDQESTILGPSRDQESTILGPSREQELTVQGSSEEIKAYHLRAFKKARAYHPRAFMPARAYHFRTFKRSRASRPRAVKRARAYRQEQDRQDNYTLFLLADSESEDLCIYPVPRYSVTSLEEVQLEARMLSCHVKDIWDPRRRYRPCLNAEVPEFHPGSFPHFPSSRGLSHRAGLFPYIWDDDRGRIKTPSPHSDSVLPKFPSTREHSCIDPVQYLPPISSSSIPVYSSTSTTVNRPQQGLKQRRTYENLVLLTNSTPHLVEQCPSTDVSVLPQQIPVYQRPPEFYQEPTAPSDARRRQGVDYSNLIFLTKGQRIQGRVQNNAPHPSSQNEEHHSNQFGQSVEGTSNSLSMVYYDFKQDYRKCLPPITLTEEIYQECQNPTGSSSTTDAGVPLELLNIQDPVASTLIARWLSEVYQDRAVEFREVNLLSQECVRLESQLCCTTPSEIENSDTNFPPMKTSTPLKDVPPTAIEDIDISRISTTAPPSSIGTNSLASAECKQQRRLYRDVVAAKCNSTHTQHQASEVIPADNSFDDLERQALEQYRNSEESLFKRLQQPNPSEDSISKRYQELERQAVEQYDESSSDDTETTNMTGEGGCRNGCPTACRNTLKSSKSTYGGFAAVNKGRLVVSESKSLSAICRDNKSERSCGDEASQHGRATQTKPSGTLRPIQEPFHSHTPIRSITPTYSPTETLSTETPPFLPTPYKSSEYQTLLSTDPRRTHDRKLQPPSELVHSSSTHRKGGKNQERSKTTRTPPTPLPRNRSTAYNLILNPQISQTHQKNHNQSPTREI